MSTVLKTFLILPEIEESVYIMRTTHILVHPQIVVDRWLLPCVCIYLVMFEKEKYLGCLSWSFEHFVVFLVDCCVKRVCWCFTSDGLSCVGQDEVVIVLETRNEDFTVPKDIFLHINYIYHEAATG